MKKVLFVFAILAAYAVSISQVTAKTPVVDMTKASVVTVDNPDLPAVKDKTKKSETKSATVEKPSGCCAAKAAAGCAGKTEAGCAGKAEAAGCDAKAKAACSEQKPEPAKK